jgi:pantetheine-phosphate adenylyltransferase
MYPGTFDPITRGHEDIVRRCLRLFDSVVVAVAASPRKQPLFSLNERVAMAETVFVDMPNVQVTGYSGLTVDFARDHELGVIVRGLRAVSDFEFEFQLATMNRHQAETIETVFLTPTEQFNFVSSSLIREIAEHGGEVAQFVHPHVNACLQAAFAARH